MKLKNPKIKELILMKDKLVTEGRAKSEELLKIDKKIERLNTIEKRYTAKVEPKELIEQGEAIKKEVNDKIEILKKLGQEIEELKIKGIPEKYRKEHYTLRSEKEKLERERNKIALQVQKVKDRLIPLIKKEVDPILDRYEILTQVDLVDGEPTATITNRVEEFKNQLDKETQEVKQEVKEELNK